MIAADSLPTSAHRGGEMEKTAKVRPWTKEDISTTYAKAIALGVLVGTRLLVMLTRVLALLT
jgi:hypothetical protein